VNKASASRTSQHVDKVNIPSDGLCSGDAAADISDVERLIRDAAAEMNIDAQQAIEGLKKDKELWNRVERLRQDAAARQSDHAIGDSTASSAEDAGMC